MKEITRSLVVSTLIISAILISSNAIAQENVQAPVNPAQGPIVDDTTGDSATTGVPATADDGFSAWWILPLIAIPILLYLVWPKNNRREDISYRNDLAGAKGGKAKRDENREDDDLF